MTYLVTGGAGFIGSHTVELLLSQGRQVRVIDNFATGRRENLPANHPALEIIEGDIRDRNLVNHALHGISHVLHLAAQVSVAVSVAQPTESASHNITGFLNVLHGAVEHKVKRLVFASSAAIYGTPENLPLRENATPSPRSPYGLEKWINERYASLFHELHGISFLGLRYFNAYGPRQDPSSPYSGVISIFCDRLKKQLPLTFFGDGQQTRDFIYVGDIARTNARALESNLLGTCNVATGHSITLLELAKLTGKVASCVPEFHFAPPRPGDIRDSAADNRKLREELGLHEFTPLQAGLEKLWASIS